MVIIFSQGVIVPLDLLSMESVFTTSIPVAFRLAYIQLTFERSYFLNALPSDSETTVFHVGNYVPVKDERFGIEKNIRIQKVKKNLLVEHDYTLTLSDITAISPITQTVVDVGRHETIK